VGNLINQLQQGGLGDTLSSWVSNQSSNLPVSGSDLQNALGSDTVNQIAQKFGVDAGQAGDLLAKVLPDLVDKATPNGTAQDADGFGLDDIASMCGGLLVFAQGTNRVKNAEIFERRGFRRFLYPEKLRQLFHKTAPECAVFCLKLTGLGIF
jgi:ribosomal protein P2